ncbi:MAG: CopG family transcriptional regulator [Archaeoglobales archaeon]|nr:MAG: CopG family transcriptional regulator [Archaeoglobales archaeon]
MSSSYVTVSVKIPRELKEKLERAGISPGKVMKKALIDAGRIVDLKELEKNVEEIKDILGKIPVERIVKSIREDRER